MKTFGTTLLFFIREKLALQLQAGGSLCYQKYSIIFIPARKLCAHAGKISCTKEHFFEQIAYMLADMDIFLTGIFP